MYNVWIVWYNITNLNWASCRSSFFSFSISCSRRLRSTSLAKFQIAKKKSKVQDDDNGKPGWNKRLSSFHEVALPSMFAAPALHDRLQQKELSKFDGGYKHWGNDKKWTNRVGTTRKQVAKFDANLKILEGKGHTFHWYCAISPSICILIMIHV